MKLERNEGHESVGLVLRFAKLDQMVDALFERLHVAEKHRGIRAQAHFMRGARDLEPHAPAHFVVADDSAHARMKNLGPAAGQRSDTRFFHLDQVSRIESFERRA